MKWLAPLIALFPLSAMSWEVGILLGSKDVQVLRNEQLLPATLGMELLPGDTLHTPPNGRVVLVEGKSRIVIAPNSRFLIEAKSEEVTPLKVEFGAARISVDSVAAQKYKFKLRTAVAGVRGTEFFMGVGPSHSNLCVLEGAVQAEMASGESIAVPEGLGISEEAASRPRFASNSLQQVRAWNSATSEEENPPPVYPDQYEIQTPEHRWKNLRFSHRADLIYCDISNPKSDCIRAHSYHRFLYSFGSGLHLQATPLLQYDTLNPEGAMDSSPLSIRKTYAQLRPYELILQANPNENWVIEGGIKPLSWDQPLFLGRRTDTAEPLANPFLEARFDRHVLQASAAVKDRRPLDGLPSFQLFRYGFDIPWNSSSLHFVQASDSDQFTAVPYNFTSPQLKLQYARDSLIASGHLVFEQGKQGVLNESFSAQMSDVSAEYQVSWHSLWRAQIRWIDASSKYIAPGIESYSLGSSNLVGVSDLDQRRALISTSFAVAEDRRLEVGTEVLDSHRNSTQVWQATEFNTWLQVTGRTGFLRLVSVDANLDGVGKRQGVFFIGSLNY